MKGGGELVYFCLKLHDFCRPSMVAMVIAERRQTLVMSCINLCDPHDQLVRHSHTHDYDSLC